MLRRAVSLVLASILLLPSTVAFAAETPEFLAKESGNVTVERHGSENPVMEVARSTFWGAVAGTVLGLAVAAVQDNNDSAAIRWGFAIGTFAGFATGVYFVTQRPAPASLLEIRDGQLVPSPAAFSAVDVSADGVRVRALGFAF
jgi:hypothetical protein